ncbi:aspartyl/asparaginyl beta-hydroxylase domain-containing protein [Alteromonas sp. a30]|uniref:aspartyl/asparaginyl beta-hydroxylase domain-containing protein n=1 Tax=Alteromonas sp. a30 TaxID=2730917 RepID=UPI0022818E06|nr:aspartyl/asparaginyl beta-hydroxylase domain-containing protein [Alteromonas sp. a30]MCY7294920.1 aspartyl/asparaginyl beta-hydroxylase domain-containing protein [Alteromonas sp. a30]
MGSFTKLWFKDTETPFDVDDPYFFDECHKYPWVAHIEAHWEEIRDEVYEVLGRDDSNLVPYPKQSMVTRKNHWRTLAFMFWTYSIEDNCHLFPKTWSLIKDIPNMTAASFNLLEANTTIKPHTGDTNAIMRCHIGLSVPAGLPRCGFRVGKESRRWENGKFFMFNDAHEHTAWNNTDEDRYVMVIDVMRDEFVPVKNKTASRVLATIKQEVLRQKVPIIGRLFSNKIGKKLLFGLFNVINRIQIATGTNKLNA